VNTSVLVIFADPNGAGKKQPMQKNFFEKFLKLVEADI